MKRLLAAAAVMLGTGMMNTAADAAMPDPLELYGPEIKFKVYRDETRVGDHSIRFAREGDRLQVKANFDIAVEIFFITAYEFNYESTAIWRDGALYSLDAMTNDDGDAHPLTVRRDGDRLNIDGYNGILSTGAGTYPTNHWNGMIVAQDPDVVLNTLTGALNEVKLVKAERELVETGSGMRMATRYNYTGELTNSVWYDDEGRWVAMQFEAKDGSIIRHVCAVCGPLDTVVSENSDTPAETSNSQ